MSIDTLEESTRSPGGFEEVFREMHAMGEALDPAVITAIATRYGIDVDFERTALIIERHGLIFWPMRSARRIGGLSEAVDRAVVSADHEPA